MSDYLFNDYYDSPVKLSSTIYAVTRNDYINLGAITAVTDYKSDYYQSTYAWFVSKEDAADYARHQGEPKLEF